MLRSFFVENFLSIRNRQEISFIPKATIDTQEPRPSNQIMVYGPNGSGKTNLVMAMAYCFIKMGLYDHGMDYHISPEDHDRLIGDVRNTSRRDEPTSFGFEIDYNGGILEYSFSLDPSSVEISGERLRFTSNGAKRDVFVRTGNRIELGDGFISASKTVQKD